MQKQAGDKLHAMAPGTVKGAEVMGAFWGKSLKNVTAPRLEIYRLKPSCLMNSKRICVCVSYVPCLTLKSSRAVLSNIADTSNMWLFNIN